MKARYTYTFSTTPNDDDRPGVQVWIDRSDGNSCSLACAQGEGEMDDGVPIPAAVIRRAEAFADTVDY